MLRLSATFALLAATAAVTVAPASADAGYSITDLQTLGGTFAACAVCFARARQRGDCVIASARGEMQRTDQPLAGSNLTMSEPQILNQLKRTLRQV